MRGALYIFAIVLSIISRTAGSIRPSVGRGFRAFVSAPVKNSRSILTFFSSHFPMSSCFRRRYASRTKRFRRFRQTALPDFLGTATPIRAVVIPIEALLQRNNSFIFLSAAEILVPCRMTRPMEVSPEIRSLFEREKRFTVYPSSLTVNFFLPFARRRESIARPFFVLILSRKPCLFLRFLLLG